MFSTYFGPPPKQGWLTTPRAIILGAAIVLSPCLLLGGSCVLTEMSRAGLPTSSELSAQVRPGMSKVDVESAIGRPSDISEENVRGYRYTTYQYNTKDGFVMVRFTFNTVDSVNAY